MHKDHKKDFCYLNLHTEFSVKGDDNIPLDTRACFNDCVRNHRLQTERVLKINDIVSNEYKVRVIFSNPQQTWNNCCLLSKEELQEWIEDMKRYAEFEFSIDDDATIKSYGENNSAVFVTLKFNERPFAEHFLVLELIKHSYEYAFNFSVYQAVKFRKIINEDELLVNLHNMIFCCNTVFREVSCNDHSLVVGSTIYFKDYGCYNSAVCMRSAEDIKERLKLTQTLYSIFDPSTNDISLINNRIKCFNARVVSEPCKNNELMLNYIEQQKKFVYLYEQGEFIRSFNSYFTPSECKKRLDAYIKTYENIRIDE